MRNKLKTVIASLLAAATLVVGAVGMSGCSYCAHQLDVIEMQASTCMEHGRAYSYKCKKCSKLFCYTLEKGLYEVSEADQLPLGEHVFSTEGITAHPKSGVETPESVFDYEVVTKCGLCQEYFAVNGENLCMVVPPNIAVPQAGASGEKYDANYAYSEDGRPYTQISFAATTIPSGAITLEPYKFAKTTTGKTDPNVKYADKYEWVYASNIGSYQRFPLYIPFNANETRYAVFIIKNTTTTTTDPLKVSWSIDGDSWSDVTVAPGEIKPLVVTGLTRSEVNVMAQYMKVANPNNSVRLNKKNTIEVVGYFYTGGTVNKLDIDAQPVKTEYQEGEYFDPAGLKLYATYSDYCLGKSLYLDEVEFSTAGRPLTKNDTKVTMSYGSGKVSVNITVN